ncbi:uncharacterized protein [Drosophila kikkawai]|uniref:Uncharacterized protein n=1 Tax=Drosophila kikkawai TaxID=30033 RepID=A0ABM3C6L9_DROKI
MSFTLTSRSVIRFESSTTALEHEWRRTLMFFNVDISEGVRCDHRNEITAPRAEERNGELRNPGGGLSNPIKQCALPSDEPNKFYAQSRDDFGYRRPLHGRRSCRHLQSAKPRRKLADIASISHLPTRDSTHHFVPLDYETNNGYDEGYNKSAHKLCQNEEYQLPNQFSMEVTYRKKARDLRDCYDTESDTDSSCENPHDYYSNSRPKYASNREFYEPPSNRNCSPCCTEEQSCPDFNTDGRQSPSQLSMFRPRRKHRQTSGSLSPDYALDYDDRRDFKNENTFDSKDCDCEDPFENSKPLHERDTKAKYSSSKNFDCDYGVKRLRPPLPALKPKAKVRKSCETLFKTFKEKNYPIDTSRNCETETDWIKNTGLSNQEPRSFQRNRNMRHSPPQKDPAFCNPFKRAKEESGHYEKQENNPRDNVTVPRRTAEKIKFIFNIEEIPQPNKKYITKEVAPIIDDEIPRRQRKSLGEASENLGNSSSSKRYDRHERIRNLKPSRDKNKLSDSPTLFGIDIPYKKQELMKSCAPNDSYSSKRWDSGCDTAALHSNSADKLEREPLQKSFKPRLSLYDVRSRQRKTVRQKISGFLKNSNATHKRSNIFKDKLKPIKNQPQDNRDNEKAHVEIPVIEKKESFSAIPSLGIKHLRCPSNTGTGSHYPTVFRGMVRNINQNHQELSAYTLQGTMHCPTCDQCDLKLFDRISSGNCSLDNYGKKSDPYKESNINVCLAIRGTDVSLERDPRIIASSYGANKDWIGVGSESSSLSISRQASGCTLSSGWTENHYKNVRFSPARRSPTSNDFRNAKSRGIIFSRTTRINRQGIEVCSRAPNVSHNISSEAGCTCPRCRIRAKWSLTRQSCCSQKPSPNQGCNHTWSPDKIESNRCRPARPFLCLPNTIEMSSRPPTVVHCELHKRSNLRGNNCLENMFNKRVCLKTTSSSSGLSGISSGSWSMYSDKTSCCSRQNNTIRDKSCCCSMKRTNIGVKSPCCIAKREIQNNDKSNKCQRSIGKLRPRSCSWPRENPKGYQPKRTRSYCAPKASNQCSDSRNVSQNSNCSEMDMQLACLPNSTYDPNSTSPPPCYYSSEPYSSTGGLILDWTEETNGNKSVVEELKQELLESFMTEHNIEPQCPCQHPTPHIMFFPCMPENHACQPSPNMNSNRFCMPNSVYCWTACSNPPAHF